MFSTKPVVCALAAGFACISLGLPSQAAAPRGPGGHPDLNGTWDNGGGVAFVHAQTSADGSVCFVGCKGGPPRPAAPAAPPPVPFPHYKDEFKEKVADLKVHQVKTDPALRCQNPGLPRIGAPDKIVQTAREIVFLYDDLSGSFFRIIPIDGRKHRSDAEDSFLGDAVGHWEGDTLVVETTKFNDISWLTDNGAFHTANMKVIERLTRNGDTIDYQAVVDDPAVLVEPWVLAPRKLTLTSTELFEPPPCIEQDVAGMVETTSYHENVR